MRRLCLALALLALVWLLGAAALCFTGSIELDRAKLHLLGATVLWFVTAPWWFGRAQR